MARRSTDSGDDAFHRLVLATFGHQRYTQDSPILPNVWFSFLRRPEAPVDLILTPTSGSRPGEIARNLRERLRRLDPRAAARADVAYINGTVCARLTFEELLRVVIPMTTWWLRASSKQEVVEAIYLELFERTEDGDEVAAVISRTGQWEFFRFAALSAMVSLRQRSDLEPADLVRLRDALAGGRPGRRRQPTLDDVKPAIRRFGELAQGFLDFTSPDAVTGQRAEIWAINRNRDASVSVALSRKTVKADAAHCLFNLDTSGIRWGVIDSGVDAAHPAFIDRAKKKSLQAAGPQAAQDWPGLTRVAATYDFTFLRRLVSTGRMPTGRVGSWPNPAQARALDAKFQREIEVLRRRYDEGGDLDWSVIEPLIRVPHGPDYRAPRSNHGTHVAGILAGDWPRDENPEGDVDLRGICPALEIYDLRVFGDDGSGGDEFTIQSALEFVTYLNRNRQVPVIHGVNLSLSIPHEVESFACGRTPICDECNRLAGQGVVVVAAAGNRGWVDGMAENQFGDFRSITVTDPGNASEVITVGSTHRVEPHTYGVSYFSSRGPTGDGRLKPDLVAPGEKILGPTPGGGLRRLDGTSMAAPHVSGAAALLMARHRELIGDPRRVKDVLCRTATDLGRERYFQGNGLVDVLRAIQSI